MLDLEGPNNMHISGPLKISRKRKLSEVEFSFCLSTAFELILKISDSDVGLNNMSDLEGANKMYISGPLKISQKQKLS